MKDFDYKNYDDLGLCDSVIESIQINHKNKLVELEILKVISRVDRLPNGFTYKVKRAKLTFNEVIFVNFIHRMEFDEWSEFYRSAVLKSSKLIDRVKDIQSRFKDTDDYIHIYLGIDDGNEYNESDIVCKRYTLVTEEEEYILHDDFEWLEWTNIFKKVQ